jgi:hypothetical protein
MLKETIDKLDFGVEIAPFKNAAALEVARQRAARMRSHREAKEARVPRPVSK